MGLLKMYDTPIKMSKPIDCLYNFKDNNSFIQLAPNLQFTSSLFNFIVDTYRKFSNLDQFNKCSYYI